MYPFLSPRVPNLAALAAQFIHAHARSQALTRAQALQQVGALAIQDPKNSLVLFTYPEGSQLGVPVQSVIDLVAKRLCVGGVAPETVVAQQLIPSLESDPALLAELGRSMSIDDIFLLATRVVLNSPAIFLRELYTPEDAEMLIAVPRCNFQ